MLECFKKLLILTRIWCITLGVSFFQEKLHTILTYVVLLYGRIKELKF